MAFPALLSLGVDSSPLDSSLSSWDEALKASPASHPANERSTSHAAWEEWWEMANEMRRKARLSGVTHPLSAKAHDE